MHPIGRALVALACLATGAAMAQDPIAVAPPLLPPAAIGPLLYICDQSTDSVYWSEDGNQDGDANDPGELGVFFDATSPDPALHLATPRFVTVGPDGAVYVGDANTDVVLRLHDSNGDGDANDAGEASRYYDNGAGGPGLSSINNLVFDGDGYLYISDSGSSTADRHVTRIRDDDGDGICTAAAGEVLLVYSWSGTGGTVLERPAGLAIDADGTVILTEYITDTMVRLVDLTADGDANDAGEQIPYFAPGGGTTTDFAESIAFAPPATPLGPTPTLFVNAGSVTDVVWRFHDADGDGQIDGSTEANAYWDTTQVDGIVPATLFRIAVGADGALWCAEGGSTASGVPDRVVLLRDTNGDGDANDSGEATVWVDGSNAAGIVFGQVMGVAVEVIPPLPSAPELVRGDCNADASTNIADAIFVLSVLFPGAGGSPAPACEDACDANDDESIDIADAIATLGSLFGSPAIPLPAPSAACGPDPDGAAGALDCAAFSPCP